MLNLAVNATWARRVSVVGVLSLAVLEGACLEPPILPEVGPRSDARSVDAYAPAPLALRVLDHRGQELPLDALARHFEFEIARPAQVSEEAFVLLLLPGEVDALRDADLRARRLSERLLAVAIPLQREAFDAHVRAQPMLYAPPDSRWSLVAAELDPDGRPHHARVWPLHVSAEANAGARVVASWPAEGTSRVPMALSEVSFQFDGDVDLSEASVRLVHDGGEVGGELHAMPCDVLGFDAGTCVQWQPSEMLQPRMAYELDMMHLRDGRGAEIPRFSLAFVAADEAPTPPHVRAPKTCAFDETVTMWGCALETDSSWTMALALDAPARVELEMEGHIVRLLAPRGDALLALNDLAPGTTRTATLTMTSLSSMALQAEVSVTTHAALAPLVISEVCANPTGDEPDAEWVELLNAGTEEASLAGLHIADRSDAEGNMLTSTRTLLPGERVLLVGDAFDADAAGVLPGVTLVRMGRTIVPSGITNRGEALYLRDAIRRRLAFVPAMEGFEDRCLIRRPEAPMRRDVRASFEYAPCTPGR